MESRAKIIFLDRDGTINVDHGYVFESERLELIPNAASALGDLKRAGFSLVIVTNQSAINRGYCTEEQVIETNRRLQELLFAEDSEAQIDLVLYSPHAPGEESQTRKPKAGMFEEARRWAEFEAKDCWILGDKLSDMEFGLNAGIPVEQRILLKTGSGERELEKSSKTASPGQELFRTVSLDIREATDYILSVHQRK